MSKVGTLTIGVRMLDVPGAVNVYIGRGTSRGQISPLASTKTVNSTFSHEEMCDEYEQYIKSKLPEQNPVRDEIERIAVLLLSGKNVHLQSYGLVSHTRCITQTIEAILIKLVQKHSKPKGK
jgi:hypothetical protein